MASSREPSGGLVPCCDLALAHYCINDSSGAVEQQRRCTDSDSGTSGQPFQGS
jgi:hypothetical protein